MASSDSFFLKWITQFVDSGTFCNYVVDHLPFDEAKRYWDSLVDKNIDLKFEEVYKYCGGCIHLMGLTYRMYRATCGEIHPHSMSYVNLRRMKLERALQLPHWSKSDWEYTMHLIVESENNRVNYNMLCTEIGYEKVLRMPQENLIHLMPCESVHRLDDVKYPVVMPHLPCDIVITSMFTCPTCRHKLHKLKNVTVHNTFST